MKKHAWLLVLVLVFLMAVPPTTFAGGRGHWGGRHWSGHRHGHTGFHFYWGAPIVIGPWWYPYFDYPRYPARVAPDPPVYVQPEPQPVDYWYYCQEPQGYYPYVKNCPGGWMKVVPEAPRK